MVGECIPEVRGKEEPYDQLTQFWPSPALSYQSRLSNEVEGEDEDGTSSKRFCCRRSGGRQGRTSVQSPPQESFVESSSKLSYNRENMEEGEQVSLASTSLSQRKLSLQRGAQPSSSFGRSVKSRLSDQDSVDLHTRSTKKIRELEATTPPTGLTMAAEIEAELLFSPPRNHSGEMPSPPLNNTACASSAAKDEEKASQRCSVLQIRRTMTTEGEEAPLNRMKTEAGGSLDGQGAGGTPLPHVPLNIYGSPDGSDEDLPILEE